MQSTSQAALRRRSGAATKPLGDRSLPGQGLDIGLVVGARVRQLRQRRGLSQAQLAGKELSRAGVAKIEAGASLPSLATLEHLAAVLAVSARSLIPREL